MENTGGRAGARSWTDASLVDVVRGRAVTHPRERAFIYLKDGERDELVLDHAELDLRARRVALALARELGSSAPHGARGARVLLLHPPGLEQVVDFLG
jgi:acyl-CoA synthetase (AMP-forming)/AMP-acid ligase II